MSSTRIVRRMKPRGHADYRGGRFIFVMGSRMQCKTETQMQGSIASVS